jgi:tRNA (guanine26-N2/guanine27-N2)-dimethyltransferase
MLSIRRVGILSAFSKMSVRNLSASELDAVTEGRATVYFRKGEVFYNPVQSFNRDLSVLALRAFDQVRREEAKQMANRKRASYLSAHSELPADRKMLYDAIENCDNLRVLEGLSATGLRAIRYALEIPNIGCVTANDIDASAVDVISYNVERNAVPEHSIRVTHSDAQLRCMLDKPLYMHNTSLYTTFNQNQNASASASASASNPDSHPDSHPEASNVKLSVSSPIGHHVIDLDPYGSPSQFLSAAVSSVLDGGLLCVTATDMSILCGNFPEVALGKYSAIPVHGCNARVEMGLRTLLHTIAVEAAKHRRAITPLMTLSLDFYARIFVRVHESLARVKENMLQSSYLFHSTARDAWATVPLGRTNERRNTYTPAMAADGFLAPVFESNEGERMWMGGPMWTGPMHDLAFVERCSKLLESENTALGFSEWNMKRMRGLFYVVAEECTFAAHPLFYNLQNLCSTLRATCPQYPRFFAALHKLGYRVGSTHCEAGGFKTDAPAHVVWDVIRCLADDFRSFKAGVGRDAKYKFVRPIDPKIRETIRFNPENDEDDFAKGLDMTAALGRWAPGADREAVFLGNPEENWGPKARAGRKREAAAEGQEQEKKKSKKSKQ